MCVRSRASPGHLNTSAAAAVVAHGVRGMAHVTVKKPLRLRRSCQSAASTIKAIPWPVFSVCVNTTQKLFHRLLCALRTDLRKDLIQVIARSWMLCRPANPYPIEQPMSRRAVGMTCTELLANLGYVEIGSIKSVQVLARLPVSLENTRKRPTVLEVGCHRRFMRCNREAYKLEPFTIRHRADVDYARVRTWLLRRASLATRRDADHLHLAVEGILLTASLTVLRAALAPS